MLVTLKNFLWMLISLSCLTNFNKDYRFKLGSDSDGWRTVGGWLSGVGGCYAANWVISVFTQAKQNCNIIDEICLLKRHPFLLLMTMDSLLWLLCRRVVCSSSGSVLRRSTSTESLVPMSSSRNLYDRRISHVVITRHHHAFLVIVRDLFVTYFSAKWRSN